MYYYLSIKSLCELSIITKANDFIMTAFLLNRSLGRRLGSIGRVKSHTGTRLLVCEPGTTALCLGGIRIAVSRSSLGWVVIAMTSLPSRPNREELSSSGTDGRCSGSGRQGGKACS